MDNKQINLRNHPVPHDTVSDLRSDLEDISSWRLTLMLVPATLRSLVAAIPLRVRLKIMTFCTLLSLAAPLALWIAPSMTIWLTILGVSVGAIFLLVGLVKFAPEEYF